MALTGLPFLEKIQAGRGHDHLHSHDDHHEEKQSSPPLGGIEGGLEHGHHHHEHTHEHGHHHHHHEHGHHHHHHHEHKHTHEHGHHHQGQRQSSPPLGGIEGGLEHSHHHHHHEHEHGHHHHHHDHGHSHSHPSATAYAPKGLSLAAAVAYPLAAIALNESEPLPALGHSLAVSAAGGMALSATTAETDYLMDIEIYRGYKLDWLLPLTVATSTAVGESKRSIWSWLPLAGVAVAAFKSFSRGQSADVLAGLDREHRHAHTHHLSAFQRLVGDAKMLLSVKPLRRWSLLIPLGTLAAVVLKQQGRHEWVPTALTAAAAGQVASLAGFRNGQRPLLKTLSGRAKGWVIGALLAGLVGAAIGLFNRKK